MKYTKSKVLVNELLEYYTQEELAAKIKVSYPTISRWKNYNDPRKPNYLTHRGLRQILNGCKSRERKEAADG